MKKFLSLKRKEYLSIHGNPMLGKHHSEETKRKMSIIKMGKSNPVFGSKFIWITNGVSNKRMPIGSDILDGWRLGLTKNRVKDENDGWDLYNDNKDGE